jgi:hypothetical protein
VLDPEDTTWGAVDLANHSLTPDARAEAAEEHEAMPDGSYPIRDRVELKKAIQAVGRAKDYAATKKWIMKRARQLKATDLLPETWRDTGDVKLSQPMTLLRSVLDGPQTVELAQAPVEGSTKAPRQQKQAKKHGKKDDQYAKGRHQLPPGAVGWKHGWIPVDQNGNAVGPSQENKSAQEIKDMVGHDQATKDAIAQAYKNKAKADAKKAATKAKSAAAKNKRKAEAAQRKAAAEAKRRAKAKERAKKQAEAAAKRKAAAEAKAKATKDKARQQLITQATKQALADKKAGRALTPSQQRLIDAYEAQQAKTLDELRNNVSLSQPMAVVRAVLDGPQAIDLAAPGSRGYIYTHGWHLKAGVHLPNRGILPKKGGKTEGHKVVGKDFSSPEIDKLKAAVTRRVKASKAPAADTGKKTPGDIKYSSAEASDKFTKAKQAGKAAADATVAANKAKTAQAHAKAVRAHLAAHKAHTEAGLSNGAANALGAAQMHAGHAQALSGSGATFTPQEEQAIQGGVKQLLKTHVEHPGKYEALQEIYGKPNFKAGNRKEELQAEAVRRAERLRLGHGLTGNSVALSQPVELGVSADFGGDPAYVTTPTVSSQDGGRMTVNTLKDHVPAKVLRDAVKRTKKQRSKGRRKGGK